MSSCGDGWGPELFDLAGKLFGSGVLGSSRHWEGLTVATVDRYTDIRRAHHRVKRRTQSIMASDSEWATVKSLADRAGLGISDYVRRQLLDQPELAPDPKPEPSGLAIPDELFREVVECILIHHGLLKEHYDRDPELKARMERITRRVQRNLEMKTGTR